jgi:hypothetical protein
LNWTQGTARSGFNFNTTSPLLVLFFHGFASRDVADGCCFLSKLLICLIASLLMWFLTRSDLH